MRRIRSAVAVLRGRPVIHGVTFTKPLHVTGDHVVITGCRYQPEES